MLFVYATRTATSKFHMLELQRQRQTTVMADNVEGGNHMRHAFFRVHLHLMKWTSVLISPSLGPVIVEGCYQ